MALANFISTYLENDRPNIAQTKKITQSLQHWLKHTEAHFAREIQLLQKINFPAFAVHSDEHKIALKKCIP